MRTVREDRKDPFEWAKDLDVDPYPMNEEERAQWEADKEYISLEDAAKMLGVDMVNKDLDYYMALPYTLQVRLYQDEDESYFVAKVLELEGLVAHGDTVEEAHKTLREAMRLYFEVKLEHGDPIPEPIPDEKELGG